MSGGSPGLVVKGGDSRYQGYEFEQAMGNKLGNYYIYLF